MLRTKYVVLVTGSFALDESRRGVKQILRLLPIVAIHLSVNVYGEMLHDTRHYKMRYHPHLTAADVSHTMHCILVDFLIVRALFLRAGIARLIGLRLGLTRESRSQTLLLTLQIRPSTVRPA